MSVNLTIHRGVCNPDPGWEGKRKDGGWQQASAPELWLEGLVGTESEGVETEWATRQRVAKRQGGLQCSI